MDKLSELQETCRHLIQEKAIMQQELENQGEAIRELQKDMQRHRENTEAHRE